MKNIKVAESINATKRVKYLSIIGIDEIGIYNKLKTEKPYGK